MAADPTAVRVLCIDQLARAERIPFVLPDEFRVEKKPHPLHGIQIVIVTLLMLWMLGDAEVRREPCEPALDSFINRRFLFPQLEAANGGGANPGARHAAVGLPTMRVVVRAPIGILASPM